MEDALNKIFLSWTAPEFIYYEKTNGWFIGFGIIAIGFFIVSLIMRNYFFAFLIPLASFLIYIQAQKRPKRLTIKITEEGIRVGNFLFLNYPEIISFWIFEDSEIKYLSIETKKILQPRIALLLADQEPTIIRETLIKFIEEKKHDEQLTDIIAKKLKF